MYIKQQHSIERHSSVSEVLRCNCWYILESKDRLRLILRNAVWNKSKPLLYFDPHEFRFADRVKKSEKKLLRYTSSHLVPFCDGSFGAGASSGFCCGALISASGFATLGSGLGTTTASGFGTGGPGLWTFSLGFSGSGSDFAGFGTSSLALSSSGLLLSGFVFSSSVFLASGSAFGGLGTSGLCLCAEGLNFSGSGILASGLAASSGT